LSRVFVDTNVLFPYSLMDMMLTLAEDGIHEFMWSDDLLDEWEEVIVREGLRSADSAKQLTSQIHAFFAEGYIARSEYAHLIASMPGKDPDDHLHMAAAIAGGVDLVITSDARDYPRLELAQYGIRVLSPDEYLVEVLGEVPDEVMVAVQRISDRRKRPPMTVDEVIDRLANAGARHFAIRLRDLLAIDTPEPQPTQEPSAPASSKRRSGWVQPREVPGRLNERRPPPYQTNLRIPKHTPTGADAHSYAVEALVVHVLGTWPQGTVITIDYANGTYAQALIYPPHVLTEVGPSTPHLLESAVGFGWLNPATFTARHADFESQPVWQDNPVREWNCTVEDPREIGLFIQASVQALLNVDISCGYRISIFNSHPEYWPTTPARADRPSTAEPSISQNE
jgi:predicted nucleic acid-binding protein